MGLGLGLLGLLVREGEEAVAVMARALRRVRRESCIFEGVSWSIGGGWIDGLEVWWNWTLRGGGSVLYLLFEERSGVYVARFSRS